MNINFISSLVQNHICNILHSQISDNGIQYIADQLNQHHAVQSINQFCKQCMNHQNSGRNLAFSKVFQLIRVWKNSQMRAYVLACIHA